RAGSRRDRRGRSGAVRPRLAPPPLLPAAAGGAGCRDADHAREDARRAARDAEEAARKAAREAENAAHDAQKAGREVREAVADAQDAAREAGRDAQRATRDVQKEAREAATDVREAGKGVEGKAAFARSKGLSPSPDCSGAADERVRTLTLTGVVPTPAERTAAGRIARETAP